MTDYERCAYGCMESVHPGLSHAEFEDVCDAARNERLISRALDMGNWAEGLFRQTGEAELRRLKEKEKAMLRGDIRDASQLSPKERRAYEAALGDAREKARRYQATQW